MFVGDRDGAGWTSGAATEVRIARCVNETRGFENKLFGYGKV